MIPRLKQAIDDIREGKMVIMIDAEDRENEGDLVFAANFSTLEKVNFAITEARGVLCVALNKTIANKLNLNLMVDKNSSCHETAFTVSVDAKKASTGVSAYERDMTIKLLADYSTNADDLVRPGHIFPLIAKDGGVLERTGHTEGSVDLCRLAGITQAAVICEIVKEDGMMARRPDLDKFAKKHNLNIIYVSDLIEYRIQNETLIKVIAESKENFMGEMTKKIIILDHKNNVHTAYIFGKIDKKSAVKFHKVSSDIKLLANQKQFDSLIKSIEYLRNNSGVLVFLEASKDENNLVKDFGIGAQILKYIGVENIELLSNSEQKEFVGIGGFGLNVENYIDPLKK